MTDWQLLKEIPKKDIYDEFYVKRCHKAEYYKLMEFHYLISKLASGIYLFFGLYHKDTDILYGIVCYGTPLMALKARDETILGKILKKYHHRERLSKVNKLIIAGRRLVLHPSVRGIGFSAYLLGEAHKMIDKPFIEYMSVMSYYNNFFHPQDYAYYIKVNSLHSLKYVYTKRGPKGEGIRERIISPEQNYGYTLYVKKELLEKEYLQYLR